MFSYFVMFFVFLLQLPEEIFDLGGGLGYLGVFSGVFGEVLGRCLGGTKRIKNLHKPKKHNLVTHINIFNNKVFLGGLVVLPGLLSVAEQALSIQRVVSGSLHTFSHVSGAVPEKCVGCCHELG